MRSQRTPRGVRSEINITPYIDILLVLLIIFMVIQPVQQFDLRARVPDVPNRETGQAAPAIVLTVTSDFRVEINGERVAWNALGERLFEIYRGRSQKYLFIRGGDDLAFGSVARIIDIAKGVGVEEVGLMKL
jgi:biopolymer transport protein ExbD